MKIRQARRSDAPMIARAIRMGVGEEIFTNFGGVRHSAQEVEDVFAALAERDDTQYSYLNTLVAEEDGQVVGVAVAYDGGQLLELRKSFFEAAEERLGCRFDPDTPGETVPEEFYLDTLAVWPSHRGRGIATELIRATAERARAASLPLGLLVDKTNHRARRLYESLGFHFVAERPFAGEIMDNLRQQG